MIFKQIALLLLLITGTYLAYDLSQPIVTNSYENIKNETINESLKPLKELINSDSPSTAKTFGIIKNGLFPFFLYFIILILLIKSIYYNFIKWKESSSNKAYKISMFLWIIVLSTAAFFIVYQSLNLFGITLSLIFIKLIYSFLAFILIISSLSIFTQHNND